MNFTADQIRAIEDQLIGDRNVTPPQDVLLAVAALTGQDGVSALICEAKPDSTNRNIITWRVVGLLDSDCLLTVEGVASENEWDADSFRGQRVPVQLKARIRSLSDLASLTLTSATSYEYSRPTEPPWEVATTWEIEWRDDSPAVALPTSIGANHTATEVIVDKVRQVLAAR